MTGLIGNIAMSQQNLHDLRREYTHARLDLTETDPDPFTQFSQWFAEASKAELFEVNAMTLATCTPDGFPTARIVLLKEFSTDGFVFFTNYESRKGQELAANPRATLLFYWAELERQVRIEGEVTMTQPAISDQYFQKRPRGSQLSAVASNQSQLIENKTVLEKRVAELAQQYADQPVPRPSNWGGYRLIPYQIEFWQGRENRLHDRVLYRWEDGEWIRGLLAP
jgi:pyridoxamine 5'-phosphate oxidase